MRGLYAIVDVTSLDRLGLDATAVAEAMLDAKGEGGLACLQLRAKGVPARRTLALLRAIAPLAKAAKIPFFANDRPDLALLADVDGVHVGQDDIAPRDVRAIDRPREDSQRATRRLLLGLSTHRRDQVRSALEEPIDYLALGPVFGTTTKEKADPVLGVDGLSALAAEVRSGASHLPTVAIGGIDLARAAEIARHVDMVAVISALLPREPMDARAAMADVRARCRALADAVATGRAGQAEAR